MPQRCIRQSADSSVCLSVCLSLSLSLCLSVSDILADMFDLSHVSVCVVLYDVVSHVRLCASVSMMLL